MNFFLVNQDPSCTIEPNTGVVEVPDPRKNATEKVQGVPSKTAPNARFLSWFCPGVYAHDCTYHRIPADAVYGNRRSNPS
jgi:hypothetical protein